MSLDSLTSVYGSDGAFPTSGSTFTTFLPTPVAMYSAHSMPHHARDLSSSNDTSNSLGSLPYFNASAILATQQQYKIQVIAATFSSVTICSTICAVYWFFMMRRNFRRDLILLLIIGDVWKSLWFLIFSSVTLSWGHINTHSVFCQANGYLLQTGIESCDVAIFLISLHMLLQIFPPKNTFLGNDGLYQARYWAWAAWFILPNLSASLAFINSKAGYISQGGFCSLPIRPFWYRLALSWIPRYLIWLFVVGVALRIYLHVGFEFKVFAKEKDQTSTEGMPGDTSIANNTVSSIPVIAMGRTASTQSDGATVEKQVHDDGILAPDEDVRVQNAETPLSETARSTPFRLGRRQSVPNWISPFGDNTSLGVNDPVSGSRSMPSSRRGSKQLAVGKPDTNLPGQLDFSSISRVSFPPPRPSTAQPSYDLAPSLTPITEYKSYQVTPAKSPEDSGMRAMQERRRAIQRQLRVLFIYPVVYLMFWIIPFIYHCFNYSNHYAQHPIFALSALNIFCQSFMGFADVCIFSWRERPWRHIPGSDGTFFGSFMFWRFASSPRRLSRRETRRDSVPAPVALSSNLTTAADNTPRHSTMHSASRANSHASFLNSIKHWSLNLSGAAGGTEGGDQSLRGNSDASAMTNNPLNSRRTLVPPPPPASSSHRRGFSGSTSDRRLREAELAHERLALERADWAMHHQQQIQQQQQQQQFRRADGGRRSSTISSTLRSEETKKPERREWWDRQMSLDDDDDDSRDGE